MSDEQTQSGGEGGHAAGGEHHDVTKAQHDKLPVVKVLLMVVFTCVTLVVCVGAVVQYFDMSVRSEVDRKVLSQPSESLEALRTNESLMLSRYAWADEKKGIVRIPVEKAAELVLAEWEARPAGPVEWKDLMAVPPPGTAPAAPGTPATPTTPGAPAGTAPAGTPTPAPGTTPAPPAGTGPVVPPAGTPAPRPAAAGTAPPSSGSPAAETPKPPAPAPGVKTDPPSDRPQQ